MSLDIARADPRVGPKIKKGYNEQRVRLLFRCKLIVYYSWMFNLIHSNSNMVQIGISHCRSNCMIAERPVLYFPSQNMLQMSSSFLQKE